MKRNNITFFLFAFNQFSNVLSKGLNIFIFMNIFP